MALTLEILSGNVLLGGLDPQAAGSAVILSLLSIFEGLARHISVGFANPLDFLAQAGGGEYKGGVSQAIAGYLQTKGLIDQAKILKDFGSVLETMAALFFLGSLGLAVGSAAVFGTYRQGLYFLIGPPLFYYMITATVPTTGTEVRFGSYVAKDAYAEQSTMLSYIGAIDGQLETDAEGNITGVTNNGANSTREISRFFGMFDSLVTEVVHAVVKLLVDTENKDHLRFVARERMLNFVLESSPDHEGFIRLVGAVYSGECAHILPATQRAMATRKQTPVRHYDGQSQQLAETKAIDQATRNGNALDNSTKAFLISMKASGLPEFADVPISETTEVYNPSCEQIWQYIKGASLFMAKRRLTVQSFYGLMRGDSSDIPWDLTIQDVKNFFAYTLVGQQSPDEKAQQMVGAYIFKNALERTSSAALSSQVFSRAPFNAQEYEDVFGLLAKTEAHGGFMKLKYFAQTIPYIQGFLLYLLAIAFPFFAVFLVIPSRATSFLGWLGMWAWVKSWDIGFAVVHVARDILWGMMSSTANIHRAPLNWDDPMSVFAIIYNNDPFFSERSYWMIVSILTCAVPFLTAHLCLGATGLFDMFSGTIDQTADRFGTLERSRSRRFVGNVTEHLQRVGQARFAMGMAAAGERQASSFGAGGAALDQRAAAMRGGDIASEGASTMDGTPIRDSQGYNLMSPAGMSSARMRNTAANFLQGKMDFYLGSPQYRQQQTMARIGAQTRGEAHMERGLVPDSARVAPPIMDPATGQPTGQYDMTAMQLVLGDTPLAAQYAREGVTWGQLKHQMSEQALTMEGRLGGDTGRRMMQKTRMSANEAPALSAIQTQTANFMRDPRAASGAANVPFLDRGLVRELNDLGKPSMEPGSGAGFNPLGKR